MKLTSLEARRTVLQNLSLIKKKLITESELDLINQCKKRSMNSDMTACHLNCSVQSASVRLRNLFLKGYLSRIEQIQESGGIEYFYYVPDELYY